MDQLQEHSQETFNLFDDLIKEIEVKRERKLAGKFNSIGTPFPRLNSVFPGFEKGRYILATASSGIGKTKLSKFLFVISVYKFCLANKIPLKIFYFALEETKSEFWFSVISALLKERYKIKVPTFELRSTGEKVLDESIIKYIKELESEIKTMQACIEVIDDISNPTGIYKKVREYANTNGQDEVLEVNGKRYIKGYKPNNPEEYVLVITDHISLLQPEGTKDHWESINFFSQEYCLKNFCKRFNYIVVNIQQQEASKEKQQYTLRGESIEEKLEPSLDGLADNKLTQRDCDFAIGLFSPVRYNIENYRGYDITKLQDSFRVLKVLKDRHYGLANTYIPLLMDGATNNFRELPRKEEMTDDIYKQIKKYLG